MRIKIMIPNKPFVKSQVIPYYYVLQLFLLTGKMFDIFLKSAHYYNCYSINIIQHNYIQTGKPIENKKLARALHTIFSMQL